MNPGTPGAIAKLLLLCVVAAGACLRFTALDKKVYWYDEAFTSLEVSGYSPREAAADILTGRLVTGADLNKYQVPAPSRTALDTVKALIAIEPHLTPAYFVVLRWWAKLFADSTAAVRAFSAVFGVASLALAFWLCRELFLSSEVAYVCIALMAVSPFQLLYAQEARPYSMWGATVLLSSAVLLRSMRRQSALSWGLYALCATLSLYTHLLSILVIAAHACFVVVEERFRLTRTVKAFLLSASAAVVAFLPWPYRGQHGAGEQLYPPLRWATKWVRSIAILFADFDLRASTSKALLIPYSLLALCLVALCACSIYFIWRRANRREMIFVLTLIASVAVPLSALDLVRGSSVALVTRYLYPSLLGIQIAVAYFLGTKMSDPAHAIRQWAWRYGATLLGAVGLLSCALIVRADEWWNKDPDNYVQAASRSINAASHPIIVSDNWFVSLLTLEHKLRPDVRYQLTVEPNVPDVQEGAGQIFVIRPSAHLRAELSKRFSMLPVDRRADLWRLVGTIAANGGA
jgi:uncharacterized membrane protein